MRSWLAITAVGAAFVATSISAQMRGAGAARPAMGRAPVVQRGGFMPNTAPRFSSMPVNRGRFVGGSFHTSFNGHGGSFRHHPLPVVFPHHFHGRHRFHFTSFGPYGNYGYYPSYDSYYPNTYNSSDDSYAEQNYQLQQELSRLSNEVQQLREEQAERSVPPAPPQSAPQAPNNAIPTALVLRNGKTLDVDNYAIAGGTIWVFTKQGRRKIPLSEVNISGTQKANEERGAPFQMPDTP
jgi:hypothetical protein